MLQQAVRAIFGADQREVGNPGWMTGAFDMAGCPDLEPHRIIVFALSLRCCSPS